MMMKAFFMLFFLMIASCGTVKLKSKMRKPLDKATCTCDLLMKAGWRHLRLLNILTKEISAWGPGSEPCVRMQEGCRILCEIMGRRHLQGRDLNSNCQGTKLGQRLCEYYSQKNGYTDIKAPGRRVSLGYRLDRCRMKGRGYLNAFNIRGNLCCSSVAPFKELPFLKFMVWNKTCTPNVDYTFLGVTIPVHKIKSTA